MNIGSCVYGLPSHCAWAPARSSQLDLLIVGWTGPCPLLVRSSGQACSCERCARKRLGHNVQLQQDCCCLLACQPPLRAWRLEKHVGPSSSLVFYVLDTWLDHILVHWTYEGLTELNLESVFFISKIDISLSSKTRVSNKISILSILISSSR